MKKKEQAQKHRHRKNVADEKSGEQKGGTGKMQKTAVKPELAGKSGVSPLVKAIYQAIYQTMLPVARDSVP